LFFWRLARIRRGELLLENSDGIPLLLILHRINNPSNAGANFTHGGGGRK